MIVVVGRVRTNAEKRKEFVRIGQALATASRQEAGCLNYRLYEDTEVENDFVFIEEWESDEALQEHFGTPHIAEFMGAVSDVVVAAPEVAFHTVESSRDLSNVSRRS